jgi:hypothetical protein
MGKVRNSIQEIALGNDVRFALANDYIRGKAAHRQTGLLLVERSGAPPAPERHHLADDAQGNLLGSGRAQVETGGRPYRRDLFF